MKLAKAVLLSSNLFFASFVNAQNINTATNGLTKSGSSVLLGGILTQATSIDLGTGFSFKFSKGTSNYFFVSNNGSIGIGTVSPTAQLHTTGAVRFQGLAVNDALNSILVADPSGNLSLRDASTLGSGGGSTPTLTPTYIAYGNAANVLSGSSNLTFDYNNNILGVTDRGLPTGLARNGLLPRAYIVHGTNNYGFAIVRAENDAGGANLVLYHTRNSNAAIATPVVANDFLGNLTWMGVASNNSIQVASEITSFVESVGNDLVSGRITFKTVNQGGTLAERMRLTGEGNFGVGTVPQRRLDLYGTESWNGSGGIRLQGNNPGVEISDIVSGQRWLIANGVNTGNDGSLGLAYNLLTGKHNIVITRSDNVGIGTTNPQAKLAVNGDIFSRKVKVTQTGWSDYVFEQNYPLLSLTEVEEYIGKHKHLPDVPSANSVEENGLDLGDNQAILLKKIEELTLYIIDINKKLENLSKDNVELRKKVEPKTDNACENRHSL